MFQPELVTGRSHLARIEEAVGGVVSGRGRRRGRRRGGRGQGRHGVTGMRVSCRRSHVVASMGVGRRRSRVVPSVRVSRHRSHVVAGVRVCGRRGHGVARMGVSRRRSHVVASMRIGRRCGRWRRVMSMVLGMAHDRRSQAQAKRRNQNPAHAGVSSRGRTVTTLNMPACM